MKDCNKKICFTSGEIKYAKLKTRLRYDKISQVEFFNFLINKYLEKDMRLLLMLEEYKITSTNMGKRKAQNSTKEIKSGFDLLESIGIGEEDRAHLFDLIEKEKNSE